MRKSFWKTDVVILALMLQFAMDIAVLLNIFFVRQILSFLYLTFIPGMVLLKLLRLRDLDLAETLLFSVGLSIAYLMFHGFILNMVGPALGVSKPLSLIPLLATSNVSVFFMCLSNLYLNNESFSFNKVKNLNIYVFIPFIFLPVLSAAGAWHVNAHQDSFVLLIMLTLIPILIISAVLCGRTPSWKLYPFALLMIAIALLLQNSLISNYIYGWDIHCEYHVSKLTEINSYWNPSSSYVNIEFSKMNSMLSITLLSVVYSLILNMEETWILKIIYPLIFSFVPFGLYKLYEKYLSKKIAFLSAFFLMAHFTFYTDILHVARQMIAELFYVLLFLVLFDRKMNSLHKKMFFAIFGAALVVSHYSVAYLFLSLIFSTYLFSSFSRSKTQKKITLCIVMIFFTLSFSWYIYVSTSGPFIDLVRIGQNIFDDLFTEFFSLESRGRGVLQGLGVQSVFRTSSALHLIGRALFYITEFFIIIGFLSLIAKRRKTLFFDNEFFILIILNLAIVSMSIIIPGFASSLKMERLYHLLLFILSPLFVVGCLQVYELLGKVKEQGRNNLYSFTLVLLVLIPFFLFQVGYVYVVFGDYCASFSLSEEHRTSLDTRLAGKFTEEQDVFGSQWFNRNINISEVRLYTDAFAHVLTSYGLMPIQTSRNPRITISDTTLESKKTIFLRKANTLDQIITGIFAGEFTTRNMTEFASFLNDMSKIYANGGSEIFLDW